MFKDRIFETVVGIFTLAIFGVFFGYILIKGKNIINTDSSYNVFAKFNDIDGITIGSVVKISGLTIGEVEDLFLNESYMAVAKLKISSQYKIPFDSSLSVATSGIIGSKYLMISPGADDEMLKKNDYFSFTQSSISLDGLIKGFATKK